MKVCKKCNLEKPFNEFTKDKKTSDGYYYICKECRYGYKPHKPILEGLKLCKSCNKELDITNFSKCYNASGYESRCKPCKNKAKEIKRSKQSKDIKAIRYRRRRLRVKYNMSIFEYSEMYNNQNGCCKICNIHYEKLCVDHCHDTNVIRGLLCSNCNTGLGMLKDNSVILENAILYLKETNTDKS